jgi:DNA-binding CsgD family transcriptional regulator
MKSDSGADPASGSRAEPRRAAADQPRDQPRERPEDRSGDRTRAQGRPTARTGQRAGGLRTVLHAAPHFPSWPQDMATDTSTGARAATGTVTGAGIDTGAAVRPDRSPQEERPLAVHQVTGPHARELVLRELAAEVCESTDMLRLHPPPLDRDESRWRLEADAALARRGVRVRALYPRALLTEPAHVRFLHELSDAGVVVRVIDHAAHDMLIFDRHTVCLPGDEPPAPRASCTTASPGGRPDTTERTESTQRAESTEQAESTEPPVGPGPSMIRVRGTALVRSFTAIYESYWQRATPLPLAGTGLRHAALGELERAVIRLMTNGYGDDRIARRLGIERRTVEDVMAALMERLGAGSRFEVGYKLARALDPSELSPGCG